MTPKEFEQAVQENWSKIYDLKTLRKKFLNTLKFTKNTETAAWAFSSNLHLRNFVFEGNKEFIDVREAFPELFGNMEG
jgi:hypothetical protein